jgi:hypothetical protein
MRRGTLKNEINEELEKCKNSDYVNVRMNLYFIEDKRKGRKMKEMRSWRNVRIATM